MVRNNYKTNIMKVYIVDDLDSWQNNPLRNFRSKNCRDKEKYVYSDYEIEFDGKHKWSFDNDHNRNVLIFGVDNNDFIILGQRHTVKASNES